MKLSWRDIVTTALVIAGGFVVYAQLNSVSWAFIDSWRVATAVLALLAVGVFVFSRFDFSNSSWLNMIEMTLGVVAVGFAVLGLITASETMFYLLAATAGTWWLLDTARHARHSYVGDGTSHHRHIPSAR